MTSVDPICSVNYIDHVGVAVKDIDAALKLLTRVFGTPSPAVTELPDQGVKATLIQVGQTRLELLEPLSEDSAVGRFIERRGEGLHHLAFNVTGLPEKLAILETLGVQLVDRVPRQGLSGDIAFVHPRSIFGVLTELVESRADDGE